MDLPILIITITIFAVFLLWYAVRWRIARHCIRVAHSPKTPTGVSYRKRKDNSLYIEDDAGKKRYCPLCKSELKKGDNVIAEDWGEVREGVKKILIKGCRYCRENKVEKT